MSEFAVIGLAVLLGVFALWNTVFTVGQQEAAIIERFGKFVRASRAGLNFKIPFLENIRDRRFSLKVRQAIVEVETITKDKVPVDLEIAVQYYVADSNQAIRDAFYRLANPKEQIESYVFDTARARVPTLDLDELFEKKDDIAEAIKTHLGSAMQEFGFTILTALVKNIDPDEKVKQAMADINAAQREQEAAKARGETARILKEKDGEGMGDMRAAMISRVIKTMRDTGDGKELTDEERQDIHFLVMWSMYVDAMEKMAATSGAKVIFMPSTPGGAADMMAGIRQAMLEANAAGGEHAAPPAS
jgi:regulator of protease activity HflC (stomatin/prohibitin superfamily)